MKKLANRKLVQQLLLMPKTSIYIFTNNHSRNQNFRHTPRFIQKLHYIKIG